MFVAGTILTILSLYVTAPAAQPSSDWGSGGAIGNLLILAPFLAFTIVGALIASRRPENPIGWICLVAGLFWTLIALNDQYTAYALATTGVIPFPAAVAALSQWLWVPPVGLLSIYLILFFPDGRLPSRRWAPLAWFSGAVMVLVSLAIALAPGPLPDLGGVRNPFGLEGYPWIADATNVIPALLPLCTLASAFSLVLRYRRSGSEEREQIKWIAFAGSFVGLMSLITVVSALVFAPEFPDSTGTQPLWLGVLQDVELLSFAGIPVAVGIAVLRYRLYDIDVIINRTLVYGSLTATLIALYFGGIVVLQRLFVVLTGQQSTFAVVASTLLIATLFSPLRRRIQAFIDRRFYRKKYDARKTLEAFSTKLREGSDLDVLSNDLVGVVRETMQPAHVSLWLRPDSTSEGEQAV
ncbi:MAG TPA: hypothetical protein VHV50_12845 [Actinomycetota bacterium]|nr:hypothetical protein [Actinomycetota bacterium]